MLITVSGKHLDLGDSLKAYITNNLQQVLTKRSDRITDVRVTITKEKQDFIVDILAHHGSGHHVLIKGGGHNHDVYHSVDQAIAKIEKQINKYHDKLINHHQTPKQQSQLESIQYVIDASDEEGVIEENPVIIAEDIAQIPTLSVSDAVMKMDLAAANFFIFINSSNRRLNVLSYRKDGNITWVDTRIPTAG